MDELNLFIDYNSKYIISISDRGASLLSTCPTLTVVSPAMLLVAAASLLPLLRNSSDRFIPEFLKNQAISNAK